MEGQNLSPLEVRARGLNFGEVGGVLEQRCRQTDRPRPGMTGRWFDDPRSTTEAAALRRGVGL
eukprot:15449197-Alexandrium_andersonii.AAC.1